MEEGKQPDTSKNKDISETEDVTEIFKPSKELEQKEEIPVKEEKILEEKEQKQPEGAPRKKKQKARLVTFILDLALNLLIVFGLVYIIQTFIASPFKVFGPSMCDTLNNINEKCLQGYGEYIIVNKLIYKDFFGKSISEPKRGDIIVFHPPHTEKQFYIKRIIGIPGDTVKLIDGKVYIFNNEYPTGYELPEGYLNNINNGKTFPSTNKVTTFNVSDDKYFVLGDNRNASTDSRSCFRDAFQGGCRGNEDHFLPHENIEGKAWVVLWPINYMRILEEIDYT